MTSSSTSTAPNPPPVKKKRTVVCLPFFEIESNPCLTAWFKFLQSAGKKNERDARQDVVHFSKFLYFLCSRGAEEKEPTDMVEMIRCLQSHEEDFDRFDRFLRSKKLQRTGRNKYWNSCCLFLDYFAPKLDGEKCFADRMRKTFKARKKETSTSDE